MPFSAAQLEEIFNASLDMHLDKMKVKSSGIENKPLLEAMKPKMKTFPGGKELLTVRVKGEYDSDFIEGFEHDDQVGFTDPSTLRTASYPWKPLHGGITFSMHQLAKDGIHVTDSTTGKNTATASDREKVALAGMLENDLEHMSESWDKSFNLMLWRDGTASAKHFPGLTSFIVEVPTAATIIAGIDPVVNTWWRNRASLAINAGTPANQVLVQTLQNEMRQLKRFGSPRHLWLAGSDFLDAFEDELRAKGNYTLTGWAKSGRIDASVADLEFKGVAIEYDPTLDVLGKSKYSYVIDTKAIHPKVVEGQDMVKHAPARPHDQYVFFRSITWMGGLVCDQRNTSGVYSIA